METKEKETELVQLIRQLKDYVILERKDYEKLVQNSSPEKFNESALEARDASIKLLEQQLTRQEELYVSFAILPLWAAISLIGIKLAIPVAKELVKDDKNINKKLLSIRLKISNKETR